MEQCVNEFLKIEKNPENQKVFVCGSCDFQLGPADQNHKLHCLLDEGPIQEAGPHVNPHHLHGDQFVFRQFYCPGCLTLLNTEVALKDEPILWDVQIEV